MVVQIRRLERQFAASARSVERSQIEFFEVNTFLRQIGPRRFEVVSGDPQVDVENRADAPLLRIFDRFLGRGDGGGVPVETRQTPERYRQRVEGAGRLDDVEKRSVIFDVDVKSPKAPEIGRESQPVERRRKPPGRRRVQRFASASDFNGFISFKLFNGFAGIGGLNRRDVFGAPNGDFARAPTAERRRRDDGPRPNAARLRFILLRHRRFLLY